MNEKKDDGTIVTNQVEARFTGGVAQHHLMHADAPVIQNIEGINIVEPVASRNSFSFQARARHIDETCRYSIL